MLIAAAIAMTLALPANAIKSESGYLVTRSPRPAIYARAGTPSRWAEK